VADNVTREILDPIKKMLDNEDDFTKREAYNLLMKHLRIHCGVGIPVNRGGRRKRNRDDEGAPSGSANKPTNNSLNWNWNVIWLSTLHSLNWKAPIDPKHYADPESVKKQKKSVDANKSYVTSMIFIIL
ncbi:hypothetical protein H0H93_008595, partial [Arthromyces matolae]